MSVFMLHFESRPIAAAEAPPITADCCAIADSLAEAEAALREAIADHGHQAGPLIAFAKMDEEQVATLGEREATLYLKALKQRSQCAVQFNRL